MKKVFDENINVLRKEKETVEVFTSDILLF